MERGYILIYHLISMCGKYADAPVEIKTKSSPTSPTQAKGFHLNGQQIASNWLSGGLVFLGGTGGVGVQIPSSSCNIFHVNKLKPLLLTPLLGKFVDIVIINLRKVWSPHLTIMGLSWLIQANLLAPACLFIYSFYKTHCIKL